MCCCGKPVINGEPGYKWQPDDTPSIYPPNPPALGDFDTLLYDEPGRCGGTDCHSHHYRVIQCMSTPILLVQHGGGREQIRLHGGGRFLELLGTMDSTARYWLLHTLYYAFSDGKHRGTEQTAAYWRTAALEKRIKVRKIRNSSLLKVEIRSKFLTA